MNLQLQPAQKAALALWLCAARRLDAESCRCEDPESIAIVEKAYSVVIGAAASAGAFVESDAAIGQYLVATANHLAELPRGAASAQAAALVQDAETLLRTTVKNVNGTRGGGCSVLELAVQIETQVRQLYEAERRSLSPPSHDPTIEYVIALANEENEVAQFAPFCIGGNTSIWRLPRIIRMILKAEPLNSRDLWHIAYTLHHELVCHAFQGAFATKNLPDASPRCHWSEGWMDTLAFDLVMEWKEAPEDWLPLRGDDATGALRRIHDHRYTHPRLKVTDANRRRRTREAFRRLAQTLEAYEIAASAKEARDITRRFSLAANAHCDADCKRLNALVTKLRTLLLEDYLRPDAAIAVARACLAFTANQDLGKLEQTVDVEFFRGGGIS